MARHRRRHYGGAVEVNLGDYAGLERSVQTKEVLIGLGVGVVGAAAFAWARKKFALQFAMLSNPYVVMASPVLGGAVLGYAAWFARKKTNRSAGYANLLGAIGAGAALAVWPKVSQMVGFSGAVALDLPYGGLLVDDSAGESDQGLHGLLVDDAPAAIRGYADMPGMGRLAAASLDEDEDYGEVGQLARFAAYREYAG